MEKIIFIAGSDSILLGSTIRRNAIIGTGSVVSGIVYSNSIIICNTSRVVYNIYYCINKYVKK